MKERMRQNWYWFPLVGLVFAPLVYSYSQRTNPAYWEGAFGNWLATMLGVIAGIPVALEINRRITRAQEQKRAAEARLRGKRVLGLIEDELRHNARRLETLLEDENSIPFPPVKNDLWEALSDSGEIRWIDNPVLLSQIASAYHYIGVARALEEMWLQTGWGLEERPVRYGPYYYLLETARTFAPRVLDAVNLALERIEQSVTER